MSGSSLEGTDAFHYELVCLLSPSSFEVKSDGHRAKNTSLDRLRIYSHPVTDEDHVCQTCRGAPRGQNRDIHLTFSGLRMQHATGTTSRLPSLAPLCCARQLYTTTETRCELGDISNKIINQVAYAQNVTMFYWTRSCYNSH